MKKKVFKFITHPILHIVVSVAALWFSANAWLAGGFLAGLFIGLIWGIKGMWTQIKLRYVLYPRELMPEPKKEEKPKSPAKKKTVKKKAIVKRKKYPDGK